MDFTSWLVDTITVAAPSGVSNYGDPTFGASSTLAARVQSKRQIIKARDGEEIISDHVIYTANAIAPDSRVWLPGDDTGDANEARRVLATYETHDKPGAVVLYKTLL